MKSIQWMHVIDKRVSKRSKVSLGQAPVRLQLGPCTSTTLCCPLSYLKTCRKVIVKIEMEIGQATPGASWDIRTQDPTTRSEIPGIGLLKSML